MPKWRNLFLEGPRGAGKTTILMNSIAQCPLKTGGFAVKRVFVDGTFGGMEIVDLITGTKDWLIHIDELGNPNPNPNCFLTVGVPAIGRALLNADLIIFDELGRIELPVLPFIQIVQEALDSEKPVIGVLKDESNQFLDGVRYRQDVRTVRVEEWSRETANKEFKTLLTELVPVLKPYLHMDA